MKSFAIGYPEEAIKEELLFSLQGCGAFYKFKNILFEYKIKTEWEEYENAFYTQIAENWCDYFNLEYSI